MNKYNLNQKIKMDDFLEKRILEIEDIDERKKVREMLEIIMPELYQYAGRHYQELEEKLESEKNQENEDFTIYTGIASKKEFDITNGFLFPMQQSDLTKNLIDTKVMLETMKKEERYKLFTAFFELDFEEICNLLKQNRKFKGYIYTSDSEYAITAEVQKNIVYEEILQNLFLYMTSNGYYFKTPCAPYISKFLDVYGVSTNLPEEKSIEKIEIDFEELSSKVRFDYMPVWNLEEINAKSEVSKIASIDLVQFEHKAMVNGNNKEAVIVKTTQEIYSRRCTERDIFFVTEIEQNMEWDFYKFHNAGTRTMSKYELFGNKGDYQLPTTASHTKANIFRLVKDLGYEQRLILQDISNEKNNQLILNFLKQKEDFLQQDVMNYIVAVVQRRYPEYVCEGRYI